jgi:hypothetical protein
MSEKPNLYQRIIAVMGELDYVQKEAKKNGIQYTFVSHDAVTAKIHPLLVKHGIAMLPSVIESKQDGNRTEATVQVTFINVDDPKDSHAVSFFGYGIDNQDKGPGKAMSYAVKYAMLKTFCLETGDDPEKDDIPHLPARPAAKTTTKLMTESSAVEKAKNMTPAERYQAAKDAIETTRTSAKKTPAQRVQRLGDLETSVRNHPDFDQDQKDILLAMIDKAVEGLREPATA